MRNAVVHPLRRLHATLLPVFSAAGLALALAACGGGGGGLAPNQAKTAGDFLALGINMAQGETWELNRAIRIEFNHPVDPNSVGFQTVLIRGTSSEVAGRPVTGSFELEAGSDGRILVFRPSCPRNDAFDDGAFLPGGHSYRIELPSAGSYGNSVLRDTAGHLLSHGIQRSFKTPTPPSQPLFLDLSPAPANIVGIDWPARLNLFTDPEPVVAIHFDQAIDSRSNNLNVDALFIQYSNELASAGGVSTFPAANLVPGTVVLSQNCTLEGAVVYFQISGILPPDRNLRLTMKNSFRDIAGQTQVEDWTSPLHATPTLEAIYGDHLLGWTEDDPTIDEFSDFFADSTMIDPAAALTLPAADWAAGGVTAGFSFPGRYVSESEDFYWGEPAGEIQTNGQTILTDSNNRSFTVSNGVIYVDDFTIASNCSLRGRGTNPLIIYATGDVRIYGTLDVSGNDSSWPTSLNSPQFPVGPVLGECGGGLGGIASREGLKETLRGDPGDGPFGLTGSGGGGGEGGFQQAQNVGTGATETANLIAGGGGGGGFARTSNLAIHKKNWLSGQRPNGADNLGPDHDPNRSPYWPDGVSRPVVDELTFPVWGAEPGMRGSSHKAHTKGSGFDPYNPQDNLPHGVYGMEDETVDLVEPKDTTNTSDFDPKWNVATIPFDYGHPTDGPDPGSAGGSVFSADGDTGNDFFGSRYNVATGEVVIGELLTPWAGAGGGASGDSQVIPRQVISGVYQPLVISFPARPFPPSGGGAYYRKGAAGGGGGGQVQILAIGTVLIGGGAAIYADGGIGHGGESTIYTYGQVSGSGGGSGGHIVVHTATKLDLGTIYVGGSTSFSGLTPVDAVRAIGGRRGWAGSWNSRILNLSTYDGNGDLMIGRGGAGANGVIQFHVPDPEFDVVWPVAARTTIRNYIHNGDPVNNPVDTNRLEEAYDLFGTPRPYALVPFFSARSQVQSRWIDTGLAALRAPAGGTGPYPDWAGALLKFQGIDTLTGEVLKQAGQFVRPLADIVSLPPGSASFTSETAVFSGASTLFAGLEQYLRTPETLVGYDLLPDEAAIASSFEIVSASYDPATDRLSLATSPLDGSLLFAVNPANNSSIRPKFFRISTTGAKDSLPVSTKLIFEFQGADDPEETASYTAWTADLSDLKGKRAIRYRVTFDIDAQKSGVSQASVRPTLEYVKLPFEW